MTTLRIGVFGLFRPHALVVGRAVRLRGHGELVETDAGSVARVALRGPSIVLSVPGKIERRFEGALEVTARGGVLTTVVLMERETAVASVVAAESPPGAPFEFLKAQAVVTRSYYGGARGRHEGFDFCDTTHCQFLRGAPGADSEAKRAAASTRGAVLGYRGATVAALFTASCGGRTRALAEPGPDGYPYFEVECPQCRAGEAPVCAYCPEDAAWPNRRGHGLGLCQAGGAGMARGGARFEQILSRYFPATTLLGG